ncbi:MAG TPA: hypothetical protein VGI45_02145 [Terracidiphilus sp.]
MRSFRHLSVLIVLGTFVLGSSQRSSAQSADLPDTAPIATIGAGSTVAVNVDIVLPANQGTIYFQSGAITSWDQIDKKAPSCRLSAVESQVVRRLVPGRKIVITGTRQNNASVNFYGDVLEFQEDATVGELQCAPGHKGAMTIGELKQVFGGMFSLIQAPPVVGE